MSVLHISEEEAVNDFARVLRSVDEGNEVVIRRDLNEITVARSTVRRMRSFNEALAVLDPNSPGVMDESFANDVASFRSNHPESLNSSQWD